MKRFIAVVICIALFAITLAGCGEKDRIMFKKTDFDKYLKLGDYKNIIVDTSSSGFKTTYEELQTIDVKNGDFFVRKTEGKVADGDNVNINYCGKIDGVEFEGGTNNNTDLIIGSHRLIDGFEEGLIGVDIGSTVDLNLTFPENYVSKMEYSGKPVVFTVTVNYVTVREMLPEEYYGELGFGSLKDYEKDLKERAVKQFIFDKIEKNSSVKDYPETEADILYDTYYKITEMQMQSTYGMGMEQYFSAAQTTEAEFKKQTLKETVYPDVKRKMIYYAILDNEKLSVTKKDADAQFEKFKGTLGTQVSDEQISEYFGDYYFESLAVEEKVTDFLYKNAKIN